LFGSLWPEVEIFRKPLLTFQNLENKQLEPKTQGLTKLSLLLTDINNFLGRHEKATNSAWGRAVQGVTASLRGVDAPDSVSAQVARYKTKLLVLKPYVQVPPAVSALFDTSISCSDREGSNSSGSLTSLSGSANAGDVCELYYRARICGDATSLVTLQGHVAAGNLLAKCYWNVMVAWGDVPGLTADHKVLEQQTQDLHKYLLAQVEEGLSFSALLLGINHELGIGVEQSWEEAFRYYKLGAEQHNTLARYNMGRLLETGKGTPRNSNEAVRAYIRAANKGHAMAQYAVGRCFMKGIGGDVDLVEASRYCKLAADQGYGLAQCGLGHCYENASGIHRNLPEAVRYYKMAADQGHSDSQYASFNLGRCYEKGLGLDKDLSEAFRYYKIAADRGHVRAQWTVGFMFENGHGTAKDRRRAAVYYTRSADAGNAASQTEVAGMYMIGLRVEKDQQKAAHYFKLAADQGNSTALYEIGCCYKDGTGVSVNYEEALKYFKLAAARGNTLARNRITDLVCSPGGSIMKKKATSTPRKNNLDSAPHSLERTTPVHVTLNGSECMTPSPQTADKHPA